MKSCSRCDAYESHLLSLKFTLVYLQDDAKDPRSKKRKRHSEGHAALKKTGEKMETTRIEHLNYKVSSTCPPFSWSCSCSSPQRLYPGMKIFGQIASIQSLALIISLPNQLFAHVPITNISSQLTELLEKVGDDSSEDSEDEDENAGFPDLSSVFSEGQYIRAVVTAVHSSGSTDQSGLSKSRDELVRASRRVELTLVPEHVNRGVSKTDLKPNFVCMTHVLPSYPHARLDHNWSCEKRRRSRLRFGPRSQRHDWILILQGSGAYEVQDRATPGCNSAESVI